MKTNKTTRPAAAPVADICLYGTSAIGFDFLARHLRGFTENGCYTPGLPMRFDSMTVAIWTAVEDLRAAGVTGSVAIFAPGGERMAVANLASVPAAGDLPWKAAA